MTLLRRGGDTSVSDWSNLVESFKKIAVTLGFDMILGQSIVSLAKAAPTAPLGLPGAGV